jgi:hypothetical protein
LFLNEIFKRSNPSIVEGGNLASHTAAGTPTVGWTGIPGNHTAGKIDSKNRAAMQPAVKQLLVDINNLFTKQYGRPIWSPELIDKEVSTFISGSSKWFMQLRQPNPNFNPQQPVSDTNPKEIGITDKDFQRVKKKVGDIDTQIDRRLEPQIEEFIHKNIGANIGSATLLGTKKGSDQWLALWQIHEPPITLQVDLEFSDYTTDARGFEIPTEWAQVSHGSAWEDLELGMKGVFRQWLYRSLAKVAPTEKYVAKITGAGKNKAMRVFGGDDGKEPVVDYDNPPPPLHDANFSFAVASVGGGGVRAKYRQPTAQENVPLEINGVPVMVPLSPADSEYIKDMSQQFEQFFGKPAGGNETKMMASFAGSVDLMKQHLTPEQQQIAVNEFLKINFGKGAQMIDADDPTTDFTTKMTAIDYLLDNTGMKTMRKQVLQMAKEYEDAFNAKKAPVTESFLKEDEAPAVKAQFRKGMPHLHDLKPLDFLDLLDEIHDGNGNFKLQNIPLNVKVDGFGGRFGKDSSGKSFMATSRTEPRYEAGFLAYHKKKGTTDPEILGRAQTFDHLFNEMMNAIKLVDSKLGPEFLINKQVTCEVLFLPFATETDEGKLKFVGIHYDKLPEGVQLALVPFRVVEGDTGEDLPDSNKFIKKLLSVGQTGSVMFVNNSLTQKEGLDVTALIPPLENLEQLKSMLADKSTGSLQRKRDVEASLAPVKVALEKAIIEDPNIIGKDILGQDYEGIVINSRLGPIKVTSQEQRQVISNKNAAKASARAEQPRANSNKTAVVAIGSFVGHRGHEELFDYTVKKAAEVGGDPYLFIGNAVGKDDPIPPEVKVQTWHKMYPKYAGHISSVQAGGSILQKIKHELINPLPGKPPRYDNIIIMVGKDQANMPIAGALMKAVNKFQGYEHVKVNLEVTPRGTGISFTKLRDILKDPKATPEQQYAVWTQGFDEQKLGRDWIKHLMNITRKGMGIQMPQQPQQEPVAEAMLPTSTFTGSKKNKLGSAGQWKNTGPSKNRPARAGDLVGSAESVELDESNDIKGTLKTITNDIGEPITNVYETLKYMAKRFYDSHGDLKGFSMVAAGVGGRWFQTFYFNRLQNELYDLCKQNTKLTVGLQQFLRGSEVKGKLENAKGFNAVSRELPDILATIGAKIGYAPLANNARRWMHNREEYEQYLSDLELSDYEDDDEVEKAPKIPKDPAIGQQRSQAEEIVNDVLKRLPSKIAGDIRNAIARAPNKIQALQQELQKRGVKVPMESLDEACWKGYKQIGMKKKGKRTVPNCVPANEDLDEGWKSNLAGLGIAGAMALGAGGAQARVTPDGQGGFTGGIKPAATVAVPTDQKPAVQAPAGFSKEYLQKAADPNRTGRYMISIEKAQELLKQQSDLQEHKRGVKAMKYTKKPKGVEAPKPRNFVAKNAINTGAGAHKNKKKEAKQKHVEIGEGWSQEMAKAIRLLENK